jgi:hypothetical protein
MPGDAAERSHPMNTGEPRTGHDAAFAQQVR